MTVNAFFTAWANCIPCSAFLIPSSVCFTPSPVFCCNLWTSSAISFVECFVRVAKFLISSATTANPRPCAPACAEMIDAFNDSSVVCSAISSTISRIELTCSPQEFTSWIISAVCATTVLSSCMPCMEVSTDVCPFRATSMVSFASAFVCSALVETS
ncbi:hypothetical protein U14_03797 [Candidatus Moduliflexus flocculans]|uniref:Uncharacterized protein n=1 Tax=Candidatus Moduliflexus flocculans TaxID=1499966 RepID=A0A081BQ79_9BACT|nr:hypothetical protein U14_03797 [Candidatus Moduliflexus flocculans]